MITVTTGAMLADGTLYAGLVYLTGIVAFQLVRYDLPAAASTKDDKAAQQTALRHYTHRKSVDGSYKLVPWACVSLFVGVVANLYFRSTNRLEACGTLLAAFGTAVNNGSNVVNPINEWMAKKDAAKDDKDAVGSLLRQVQRGHWIDLVGFAIIFAFAALL